jgi:hypothetical protein
MHPQEIELLLQDPGERTQDTQLMKHAGLQETSWRADGAIFKTASH